MDMCYDGTLVMPSSYAVMEEEEMCYLEGGKFYGVDLTAEKCGTVAATLSFLGLSFSLTSRSATVISLIPGLKAALGPARFAGTLATVCTIGYVVFDYCSRHHGMKLGYESSSKKFVYSIL